MATEYARLVFKVDSAGLKKAQRELDGVRKKSGSTDRATSGMALSFKRLAIQVAASVSALSALRKIVDVSRQFDVLNAQLITATGSAEKAAIAFEAIQQFASETPYDLAQVTTAFVKLKNLGLDPSEAALVSYGNTASAMGKSLDQMIEAVADAATGEFERLKEFGIRASKQGSDVEFTFRGVSETVKFEAGAIQDYLMGLGETEFSGAMIERMMSLDGALSNLGDEWDKLFLNISQNGVGSVIEDGVRVAIDALTRLNESIASDEIIARFSAFSGQFDVIAAGFNDLGGFMEDRWSLMSENIGQESISLSSFLLDAFEHLPTNVTSFIQILTVELLSLVDKTKAYGSEMMDNLQFWDGDTFNLEAQLSQLDALRLSSIDTILQERDAALGSYEAQMQAADDLYNAYLNRPTASLTDASDGDGGGVIDDIFSGMDGDELMDAAGSTLYSIEEMNRAFNQRMIDADEDALQRKIEGYSVLTDAAKEYFAGLEGQDAAYARAALSIGENLLTEQGRQKLASLWNNTYDAAMGAYSALAGIPFVGPALGAAAFAGVIATGTAAAGSMITGGRELGGQVLPGNSYIVGERGPEVLHMGSTGGNVSNKMGQYQQPAQQPQEIIINQNIQAHDSKDVRKALFENQDYLAGLINRVMNDRGVSLA